VLFVECGNLFALASFYIFSTHVTQARYCSTEIKLETVLRSLKSRTFVPVMSGIPGGKGKYRPKDLAVYKYSTRGLAVYKYSPRG